jgi:hypothetical protein
VTIPDHVVQKLLEVVCGRNLEKVGELGSRSPRKLSSEINGKEMNQLGL